MPVIIRDATEADAPAIRDIYNYEIVNGWATFDLDEKSLEDRLGWFRETQHPHFILVAEDSSEVVGWASLRAFHERLAYRFTASEAVYTIRDTVLAVSAGCSSGVWSRDTRKRVSLDHGRHLQGQPG